ncbi:MAG: hypothetical protein DIU56_000100 [Pseudomonadota bacterium]|jgi:hypothetical protein
MKDLLIVAAHRLGIPTDVGAGPGEGLPGNRIWARWPRDRRIIAHELLQRVLALDARATLTPAGASDQWCARCDEWSYTGRFEDAVARLAMRVTGPHSSSIRLSDPHTAANDSEARRA